MKPKVMNCGNYNCVHCTPDGRCGLFTISIGQDGKCICFKKDKYKTLDIYHVVDETDEHTNMC